MNVSTIGNRDKLAKAEKKVKDLKGFYIHLTVYILVNIFIYK